MKLGDRDDVDKDGVQARIAKMIPGGLLLEFMSYDHIVELMTVSQIIANLHLNKIEQRGELADDNARVIVPYNADFVVETILTRGDPPLLPERKADGRSDQGPQLPTLNEKALRLPAQDLEFR